MRVRIFTPWVQRALKYLASLDKNILPTARGYYLNDDDLLRRRVITKLMCDFELDFKSIENEFDIDFETYFDWGLGNLKEMIADDLVVIENRSLKVTPMGRMLVRNIAINFDGYIERQEDNARYSRTV
jgi:oxygen-independent coproporphyrinogen-3 oxidase